MRCLSVKLRRPGFSWGRAGKTPKSFFISASSTVTAVPSCAGDDLKFVEILTAPWYIGSVGNVRLPYLGAFMFRPHHPGHLPQHHKPHHPGHLPHHHQAHHPHPPHKGHLPSAHNQKPLPLVICLVLIVGGIVWLALLGASQVIGWLLALCGVVGLFYRGK